MISTKVHGVLDYLIGAFLILMPFFFELEPGRTTNIPIAVGAIMLLYSLFTRYELGFIWRISMKVHLILDVLLGCFLGLSPWIFGIEGTAITLFVIVGVFEVAVGFLTSKEPSPEIVN